MKQSLAPGKKRGVPFPTLGKRLAAAAPVCAPPEQRTVRITTPRRKKAVRQAHSLLLLSRPMTAAHKPLCKNRHPSDKNHNHWPCRAWRPHTTHPYAARRAHQLRPPTSPPGPRQPRRAQTISGKSLSQPWARDWRRRRPCARHQSSARCG